MKASILAGFFVALLACAPLLAAEEEAVPSKEHQWLKQLTGDWNTKGEASFAPDQPTIKCEGTETSRDIGGFWVLSELKGKFNDMPMQGIMTVGYDTEKKQYVGTWVDSMTSHMWKYTGSVDETGKILTLEADGPDPLKPGKTAKFRDVIEIKDKDHKIMTSAMQMDDGKWFTFATIHHHRKK